MRVLFVNHNVTLWINVGLTYVMSSVARKHEVFVADIMNHRRKFREYLSEKIVSSRADVVAFSVNSYTVKDARILSGWLKRKFHNIKIVFGGVHPTIMPEETISFPEVDAICIGEGEIPFLEYLDYLEGGNVPCSVSGMWFKDDNDRVVRNPLRPFSDDIDSFPWPDWELWDIDSYMNEGEIFPGTLRVLTSRGCPYNCSFCTNPLWRKYIPGSYYRLRDPINIVNEIEYNFNKYKDRGFEYLMISDSIFALNREHTYKFCRIYKERGLADKLPWAAQIRCGTIDNALAGVMKEAGCYRIALGIESGNDYMRNNVYKKGLTKEQIRDTVEVLRKAGILVRAWIMVGGPGEDRYMFDETLRFVKSLNMSISDLIIIRYVPLPRTELAESIYPADKIKVRSLFSYHNLDTIKSKVPRYYYWKLRILKVYSFIKEGLCLRGVSFFLDVVKELYKKGRNKFIPLIYLCSEQRIVNWTIVKYKLKKLRKANGVFLKPVKDG